MSCAKLTNFRIYWPHLLIFVMELSDHHRHRWLMTKEILTAGQVGPRKRAPKITHPVPVMRINSTFGEPVDGNNEIYVTCDGVQNVFQRVNNPEIDILRFKIPPDDATNTISLPADFLGNMSVTSLIQFTTYWLYWPLCLQFQIPEFGDRPYGFPIIAE